MRFVVLLLLLAGCAGEQMRDRLALGMTRAEVEFVARSSGMRAVSAVPIGGHVVQVYSGDGWASINSASKVEVAFDGADRVAGFGLDGDLIPRAPRPVLIPYIPPVQAPPAMTPAINCTSNRYGPTTYTNCY